MTLVARSWISLKRMVVAVRDSLLKRGLKLHPTKCKAQTNRPDVRQRGDVALANGLSLNALWEGEPLEVLGTMLSLTDATKAELEHRVAIGWRKFWAMKRLLMNADTS
eukprot:9150169-Pyramimonas_sp.AAC.1